ncbi:MAG: hypothetical protein CTY31_08675 [Hyphomicrobium sp.]|nr:MAG: hypothetical protein CTY39_03440 [Hyphomicrobium sp.]PPC99948.1 MAG: hypothetical protein CTY31_08675 [Hyphomicrobium sp.]
MWILIFLLAITVIVIAVLWSSGVLAESERTRGGSDAIGDEADDDRTSERSEGDGSVPTRQTAPRRPGSVPPPALAGPAYGQSGGGASPAIPARRSTPPPAATTGEVPQRADGPSPSMTSELRTSRPPPAASAGSAASASADGAAPRKRSSAPPPVQAAWSTPDAISEREPD